MSDPNNDAGLVRRILRQIPGVRPLVRAMVAQRDAIALCRQEIASLRAILQDAPTLEAAYLQETANLRIALSNTTNQLAAEAASHQRSRNEQLAALRVTLVATEQEREFWRNNSDALQRGLSLVEGRLAASEGSVLPEMRDALLFEMKSLAAQIFASRAAVVSGLERLAAPALPGGGAGAGLYLDLLEASLTGTLNEDTSADPWTAGTYDPARRAIGRDWPATACTMIGTARMRNLRDLLERALASGVPGDFIETGVWRGGACIYARAILAAYGDETRRVFVADSFRGLPEPDTTAFPADAGDIHSTFEQLAISREQVAENFRRYNLLDDRVVFLEGWFKDTLPAAPIERLAVLRLDGDMYESTIQALEALYDKVSPGGFVIVDDYILGPCASAIEDFRAARGITAPLEPVDGAAVWWQVPG